MDHMAKRRRPSKNTRTKRRVKRRRKGKEVHGDLDKMITATLKTMGIQPQPPQKERPFCSICQKTGHTYNICWYHLTNGACLSQQGQRMNAPAANIINPDRNRGMGGPPPQGACNMDNVPCTFCATMGHRQGPNCPLWCKHRNERGIPIMKYKDNQRQQGPNQQNRAPQANVVIVEEPQMEE